MVLLSIKAGLRAKEIAGLTWDRIDWQTKTLLLKTTKGNKPRHVPMAADLVKTLKAYREVSTSKKAHVFHEHAEQAWAGSHGQRCGCLAP